MKDIGDYKVDFYKDNFRDRNQNKEISRIIRDDFKLAIINNDEKKIEFYLDKGIIESAQDETLYMMIRHTKKELIIKFLNSINAPNNLEKYGADITDILFQYDRADLVDFFIEKEIIKNNNEKIWKSIEYNIFKNASPNILKKHLEGVGKENIEKNLGICLVGLLGETFRQWSPDTDFSGRTSFIQNRPIIEIIKDLEESRTFKFLSNLIDVFGIERMRDDTYAAINLILQKKYDFRYSGEILSFYVLGVIDWDTSPKEYFKNNDYGKNEFVKLLNQWREGAGFVQTRIDEYYDLGKLNEDNILGFRGYGTQNINITDVLKSKREKILIEQKIKKARSESNHKNNKI